MNKFNLPESYETIRQPFLMPSSIKRLGIIADPHVPYHSIMANEVAINTLIDKNIDALLIDGDLMDFHKLSNFLSDPRKRDVDQELDCARAYLDVLRATFPDIPIYFKMGNHDARYQNWLFRKAPELIGVREFRLEILLRLGEKHIEYIEDKTMIMAGGLAIFHGHEVQLSNISVSPARSLYLRTQISSLCAHSHRPSFYQARRADGHMIGCWSIGHLGEESPDYAPFNQYQHGFANINLDGRVFEVENYKIIKGKAYRT